MRERSDEKSRNTVMDSSGLFLVKSNNSRAEAENIHKTIPRWNRIMRAGRRSPGFATIQSFQRCSNPSQTLVCSVPRFVADVPLARRVRALIAPSLVDGNQIGS